MTTNRTTIVPFTLALVVLLAGCGTSGNAGAAGSDRYEVWLIDQSNSAGVDHGGTLYIYSGAELENAAGEVAAERIDLSAATSALCQRETGSNPVRPHMLLFNEEHSHAVVSFVASGHVAIFDAATREPLACFRSTASPTGQQAHAAVPAPDGSYIVVANQNGKRLERIDTDFATNTFTYRTDATLDLATCTTPSGAPCESPELRPINWPICPIVDASSSYTFVTLRGGGMLVVDARQTPMAIVAEYDQETVRGNGCGGVQAAGGMYINSGGSPVNVSQESEDHPHLFGFDVYRFPLSGYAAGEPNQPAPEVVLSVGGSADSHGLVATGDGEHVWAFDRNRDLAEVISTGTGAHVATVPLAGPLSERPAPDLVDASPDGRRFFLALRGPTPLSGDPHNATGSTPGLGIIRVDDDGRGGSLAELLPITNRGDDGVERADAHAVRVRRF
jgi:DNA-binding beta-propeller fold protein YncE